MKFERPFGLERLRHSLEIIDFFCFKNVVDVQGVWGQTFMFQFTLTIKVPIRTNNMDVETYRNKVEK